MAKRGPAQLQDSAIIERHACIVGEVALLEADSHYRVEFITPRGGGQFARTVLLVLPTSRSQAVFARRMMDMQAGICAAQREAGLTIQRAA